MNILGIKFRTYGQTYFFSSSEQIAMGDGIMVETEHGLGFGKVVNILNKVPKEMEDRDILQILRLALPEDTEIANKNNLLSDKALLFCRECIQTRKLDMKLIDVEIFFDGSKIVFYFTAPSRIDFRELVKDLVKEYRSRIELRQIGVRHETQMIGALGNCGDVCCCRRFLRKFAPVTIRMAKEQNLFLNPAKISGVCGRLLCCLSYEQDTYDAFHQCCPKIDKKYKTDNGIVRVLYTNMFNNSVTVLSEKNEEQEYTLDEWNEIKPHRSDSLKKNSITHNKQDNSQKYNSELFNATVDPEQFDDSDIFDTILPDSNLAKDTKNNLQEIKSQNINVLKNNKVEQK